MQRPLHISGMEGFSLSGFKTSLFKENNPERIKNTIGMLYANNQY
jgi:hypothetical protein